MDEELTALCTICLVFAAWNTLDAWRERYGDRSKWSGLPPVVPLWASACVCIVLLTVLAVILTQSAKEPYGFIPWAIDALRGDPQGGPGRPLSWSIKGQISKEREVVMPIIDYTDSLIRYSDSADRTANLKYTSSSYHTTNYHSKNQ